jgi:hypothetical protein
LDFFSFITMLGCMPSYLVFCFSLVARLFIFVGSCEHLGTKK